tara:strand:+ start:861 stop:1778 length:918 start_codon:yes stop_codon:yes gene_type:complete
MPETLAVTNQKGGVGKTTTAINVGASLALHHNKKVLLIDADQQGNLSDGLGIAIEPEHTILEALLQTSDHKVYPYANNIDVIPSNKEFSSFEANINHPNFEELKHEIGPENLLKNYIESHCSNYDYILIDCPPDLNLVTINALVACNKVLIPLRAHGFSTKGLETVLNMMTRLAKRLNTGIDLSGVFFTEHDERTILSRDIADDVRKAVDGKVFKTFVRRAIALAESSERQLDVFSYDTQMEQESNGSKDYQNLTNEMLGLDINGKAYERKQVAVTEDDTNQEDETGNTELANKFQAFLKSKRSK